jgi:hypothetical protein
LVKETQGFSMSLRETVLYKWLKRDIGLQLVKDRERIPKRDKVSIGRREIKGSNWSERNKLSQLVK